MDRTHNEYRCSGVSPYLLKNGDLKHMSIADGGRILRIDVAKTEAGVRLIEIPEVLRS